MQAQSSEDATKWERDLEKPMPGQSERSIDADAELAQLNNL